MNLETKFLNFKLKNPVILGSGPLSRKGIQIKAIKDAGMSAVVMKSVGPEPRAGNPHPRFVKFGDGVLASEGSPNPGYIAFANEIKIAKSAGIPVFASPFGDTIEQYSQISLAMQEAGADAVEILLGRLLCSGKNTGTDPEAASSVIHAVKKAVKIPVIAKLTPRASDRISEIAIAVEEAGADAITAIDALPGILLNLDTGRPILASPGGVGGLSGCPLKPIAIKCVMDVCKVVKIPVIGGGGIMTGFDVVEMMMAGACAVQIFTSIWLKGLGLIKKIIRETNEFMNLRGYENVDEFIGLALRHMKSEGR